MDETEPDSRKRKKTAFITADLDKLKKAYTSLCFDKRNPLIAVMRQDTEDVQKSTKVNPPCISCGREVRPKQHAVSCDACEGWQHRLCNTGWHNRLNTMARHGGVPFYKLVLQLRQEAEVVDVAVRSADLERESNRVYTALKKRIQKAWDEYIEGAWTTSHFLRAISSCYSPSVNTE
nr:uncharacterized protein LOC117690755 [Crassostrea gigas]XP_034331310.1 uncharacterized protein LOC117690755 [Crassostrea gigas]